MHLTPRSNSTAWTLTHLMHMSVQTGAPVCVTVTIMDGLVLARSTFHHSMNYRSVVILGSAEPVTDASEKNAALEAIVEHIVPGRSAEVSPCTIIPAIECSCAAASRPLN